MNLRKRKNIIAFLILMLIPILLCVGCKKDEEAFVVGFDAEFPPYGYIDEKTGEYIGFDLDLAKEVCDRRGWKFKAQPIDWNSKDMELDSGAIDCIWNGFTINGREAAYTWSKAYIDNSQIVVVKANSDINSLADLAGKEVVVQADSSALAAFKGEDATEENKKLAESFSVLDEIPDYNTGFVYLDAETYDALCLDIGVAMYQLETRAGEFKMLEERVSSEQYGIGFKLGNTELRDEVQETLDEMLADGTYAKIVEKWGLTDSACLGEEGTDSAYLQDADGNVNNAKPKKKSIKEQMKNILKLFPAGMLKTLLIFVSTLALAMPFGLLICTIRMSKLKIARAIATIYISIMRGTPLMLQLLVVFFGPYYLFGISVPRSYRVYAVIIGFSLNYAAYFAEIYRAGIQSIPNGQYEAAKVLGFTRLQTFWKIIFPQMVKRVIPPVTNEVITLVKDTSLAFAISYAEMFTVAQQVSASENSFMALFVAGVFYYIFNALVAFVMARIEKKMEYYS